MQFTPPEKEVARLESLRSYRILDTPPEQAFDGLTRLAAYICGTPIAFLGFVDLDRLWLKSSIGWDVPEVPRDMSFCSHTILQSDVLVASDTLEDRGRLADCPLAKHGGMRFYAGATLVSLEGHALGTLAAMDSVPRGLTPGQIEGLRKLSRQVVFLLESRKITSNGWANNANNYVDREHPSGSGQPLREHLRRVLDSAADAIIEIDEDSKILLVNQAAERIFGYSREELLGSSITVLMPDSMRQRHLEGFRSYLQTGKKRLSWDAIEFPSIGKNGEQIDLEISLGEGLRGRGMSRTFTAVCRDIGGRKRVAGGRQEALRRSEQRLQGIVSSAMHAIITVDQTQRILVFNRAAEEIFRCPASEALGQSIDNFIPERFREKHREHIQDFSKTGVTGRPVHSPGILFGVRRNGEEFPIEASISQAEADGERLFTVILRDISARLRLEGELRQAQKMEAIGQLAGGVAHEFNNFLGVILGYSDLLAEDAGENESLRQHVGEIKAATQHAASLTRQLLAFGRRQMREPQELDLNTAIWEAHKLLRPLVPANIDVVPVLAPVLGRVKLDAGDVPQILINLVVNARDAMPNGGRVTIKTSNLEAADSLASQKLSLAPGGYVVLSVGDTGTGMDDQTRSRLFEPFYTTKEPGKGTGLGLSTVYGIVTHSGGQIEVESAVGRGTTFRIYLPRVKEAGEAVEPPSEQVIEQSAAGGILIVEDEAALRRLLLVTLGRRKYRVFAAKDGVEALDLFRQNLGQIRLIVTDLMMPRMDGFQLREQIAAIDAQVRFLFMSGYLEHFIEQRKQLPQTCGFLDKPFLPVQLVEKVQELLAGQAAA